MNATEKHVADSLHNSILRHLDREHGKLALQTQRVRQVLFACKAAMYLLLGIAALTYANSAHAAELAYLPNKANGEIVLTDASSEACPAGSLIVIARARTGKTAIGCWAYSDPYVYVQWADGELSMYRLDEFKRFDTATTEDLGA